MYSYLYSAFSNLLVLMKMYWDPGLEYIHIVSSLLEGYLITFQVVVAKISISKDSNNLSALSVGNLLIRRTVNWMHVHHLLASNYVCPRYHVACRWGDICSERWLWRCPNQGCRKRISIRHGSFWEKTHVPLHDLIQFVYWWSIESMGYPTIQTELGITSEKNYGRLEQISARRVCSTSHQQSGQNRQCWPHRRNLDTFLQEFIWRRRYGDEAFHNVKSYRTNVLSVNIDGRRKTTALFRANQHFPKEIVVMHLVFIHK